MVKDSKIGDFVNYHFLRKNRNFEWKTTLKSSGFDPTFKRGRRLIGARLLMEKIRYIQ